MKNRLFKNIILKIISVVLAFIAWIVLVNISDPTTSVTIGGVNVRFENENALKDKGYTYEVLDGAKINVDVSGPKSEVTSISASDIDAYVDLSKLSSFSDYADIAVSVSKDGNTVKGIHVTPKTSSVKLNVGNRSNKEYNIITDSTGEVPEGKVLSNQEVIPHTVRIAGPEEEVAEVENIKVVYDVTGKDGHISEDVQLKLFDADGEEITDSDIELSRNMVKYTADVNNTKKVKIDYALGGKPEAGSEVTGVELSEEEVLVSGSDEVLSVLDKIIIPESALDISDLSYSKTFKIWIPDFVPDGVDVLSEKNLRVTVYIDE